MGFFIKNIAIEFFVKSMKIASKFLIYLKRGGQIGLDSWERLGWQQGDLEKNRA